MRAGQCSPPKRRLRTWLIAPRQLKCASPSSPIGPYTVRDSSPVSSVRQAGSSSARKASECSVGGRGASTGSGGWLSSGLMDRWVRCGMPPSALSSRDCTPEGQNSSSSRSKRVQVLRVVSSRCAGRSAPIESLNTASPTSARALSSLALCSSTAVSAVRTRCPPATPGESLAHTCALTERTVPAGQRLTAAAAHCTAASPSSFSSSHAPLACTPRSRQVRHTALHATLRACGGSGRASAGRRANLGPLPPASHHHPPRCTLTWCAGAAAPTLGRAPRGAGRAAPAFCVPLRPFALCWLTGP